MENSGLDAGGGGMITLAEAFRLCDIREEPVYFRHIESLNRICPPTHYFWSQKVRDKFDMQQIKVVRIELEFEHFGPEFRGWRFVISGVTPEELTGKEVD